MPQLAVVKLSCFQNVLGCGIETTLCKVPVTTKFIDTLRAEGTKGATCFKKAWEEIEECIKSDTASSRIFVVFLTDCMSGDIDSAASKAQAIFEASAQQTRAMTSFFVHITDSVEESPAKRQMDMLPLVRAANGGFTDLQFADERIPLLKVVKDEDLVATFRKIGGLVNVQTLSVCMGTVEVVLQDHSCGFCWFALHLNCANEEVCAGSALPHAAVAGEGVALEVCRGLQGEAGLLCGSCQAPERGCKPN